MAKKTGFIKRKRKFSAFEFVLLMTIGLTAMVHPSLSGMVDAIRAKISRIALHLRFTAPAAKFLQACLEKVLKHCVCTDRITPSALDAFRRVLIFDSSSWDVNPGLKHVLPGFGGGASDANCKLQAGYEYKSGSLGFFEVTEGIKPDQAYSKSLVDFVEKNDLMLTDLGYFNELYGKLIMVVLIHGIHSSLNSNMWLTKKREVSFDKLYKRIQERAFHLLQNLLITVFTAVKQFLREINRLANACIKTRQPSRKTTLELLEDVHALLLP
ncbi:MAG: transposase [Candidatus Brocadiaceae bacterium]|nr:transposase [Candidatus Brocadiaceae bacterium]MBM2835146.1 transposase [Candidatus Brocadiaceae bacterium]